VAVKRSLAFGFIGLLGCGNPPEPPVPGVDLPLGLCGHGLVVVSSDYQSTSVAIVSFEGEVVAAPVLSSGSEAPGLSAALSGDVVTPSSLFLDELLLLDRFPTGVLTFYDPVEATVTRQVDVSTGFAANPQDALRLDDGRIVVARYDANSNPGGAPFDAGSDLLVLSASGEIEGAVDLTEALLGEPDKLPRPARLARTNDAVVALLAAYSSNFQDSAEGRVAFFDPKTLELREVIVLSGGFGCGALAVSPSGGRLAVGCSGNFSGSSEPNVEESALYVLGEESGAWKIEYERRATDLGDAPLSASITFVDDERILTSSFGRLDAMGGQGRPDRLLLVDPNAGSEVIAETSELPFTLGDVRCGCGTCFVADADRGVVRRFVVEGEQLVARPDITIDDGIGLPPRYLGSY
jgi:hypothetical protein